jgi:hypothetical protein
MFQKIIKINMDIVIDIIYKHKKCHYHIRCILGYIKITKCGKLCRFEYTYSDLHVCYFLCSLKNEVFELDVFPDCEINGWLQQEKKSFFIYIQISIHLFWRQRIFSLAPFFPA